MTLRSDNTLFAAEAALLTLGVVGLGLMWLLIRLQRTRPDMAIALPVGVGVGIRVLAAMAVSLTGVASTLRGGDETLFIEKARVLAAQSFLSDDNVTALTTNLHEWVFGVQLRLLESPDLALRSVQIGIAAAGLILLAAAVHDLAGGRASLAAAWVLALEPTSVFFSSLLHKEANMLLATGLVVYGGTRLWQRGDVIAVLPVTAGCLIAIATRPYVGWFLIAAGALVTLHAAGRRPQLSSVALMAAVALVAATFVVPFAFQATTEESLQGTLQRSQDANAGRADANLTLEQVNYSSREDIVLNLPTRIRDVMFRPYPWQLGSVAQGFGLIGTIVALILLWLLITALVRNRGHIMARAGPLVYVGLMLLVAYSLSAGNAGTGFRYRTHLVGIGLGLFMVLRYSAPATAPVASFQSRRHLVREGEVAGSADSL